MTFMMITDNDLERMWKEVVVEAPKKTTITSVRIADVWSKIWTRNLPNTKQKLYPLDRDVRPYAQERFYIHLFPLINPATPQAYV
jgi:hypothetical protein